MRRRDPTLAGAPPDLADDSNQGDDPLAVSRRQFGILAIVALVALRLGIGWQFYREGVVKLQGKFSSAGFLGAAKGPLASLYHGMVPDPDGTARLNQKDTADAWEDYVDQAIRHLHLGDDSTLMALRRQYEAAQKKARDNKTKREYAERISKLNRVIEAVRKQDEQAKQILKRELERLEYYLDANDADIKQYRQGLARRDRNQAPQIMEVESLRKQAEKTEADLRKERAKVIGGIDAMWDDLESAINGLATEEQIDRYGAFPLRRAGERVVGTRLIDNVIPWMDVTIGVLLILGLFTRLAAGVAAAFIASVVLAQWPGAIGAKDVFYETDLMLALIVLAATGAGRFAGLDFFGSLLFGRCCRSRTESSTASEDRQS